MSLLRHINDRNSLFRAFNNSFINFSNGTVTKEYISPGLLDSYSCFVIGSDQVWNPDFVFNSELEYLPMVASEKKIAYAASFGVSSIVSNRDETARLLNGICSISVRESAGSNIVRDLTGRDVAVVLDPTLLLGVADWEAVSVKPKGVACDQPYLFKYVLGNDEWYYSVIYTSEIVALIVGALMCPILLQKFNKRNLSLAGCIVVVIAHALIMVNPMSFRWILVMTIIRSLGQAPLTSLVFGMMGDVVEYGQWKSHLRQESLIFGGGSLGFKIGTGITSAVMTAMLEGAGFLSSVTGGAMQPTSAQQMISSIFKFGPILVWIVAIIVLLFYKLDKIYPTIMKELTEREARGEM